MITTVLNCESAQGMAVCPKCDAMVPDYCREAETRQVSAVDPIVTTQPLAAERPMVGAPKRRKGSA